jgi:hypothetical protein
MTESYMTGLLDGARLSKSTRPRQTERSRETRIRIGTVTRSDILKIYSISARTLTRWLARGLPTFHPGTAARLFRLRDVKQFLARGDQGRRKKAA